MIVPKIVVFFTLVAASQCADLVFPTTFKFGVATSSYQIEGGWNASDKGIHMWDNYAHIPGKVADGSTGDIACDSYHKWERDIEMVEELGVDFYRFSISWSRILPTGFPTKISEDGKNYYNKLIDGLLAKGIEPVVTIYHWDLPQPFQDLGGWANPLIADWFADYARVVYSLFGDRVKTWLTINEPIAVCEGVYSLGYLAPGVIIADDVGSYLCNKNVLVAHAKAWRVYDKEFRSKFNGKVSMINQVYWHEEASPEAAEIAELSREYVAGRYSHPIYSKEGGWPPKMEKIIAKNSARLGYRSSRLPPFTPEEIELVKGTYDFYAFNYYTTRYVSADDGKTKLVFPFTGCTEIGAKYEMDPKWKIACNNWLASNPPGLRKTMLWLRQKYGDLTFFITENGYPTCDTGDLDLEDQDREDYYREHLQEVKKAITEDGINLIGYTFWSLMDNFEWMDGYHTKFGIYAVNFTDPERTRTPRQSAKFIKKIVQSRINVPSAITEPVKYNSELYMWYSFVGVLLLIVFVLLYLYIGERRKNRRGKKIEEKITPLMDVEEVKMKTSYT